MYVSSFYELGSEVGLKKKLRFRDAKITQLESSNVSIQAQVCLASHYTSLNHHGFHKYHGHLRLPSTWFLSIMEKPNIQSTAVSCVMFSLSKGLCTLWEASGLKELTI